MMLNAIGLFKCLSEETRLSIVLLLSTRAQFCVCDLTDALGLSQPKVSRHLALLKQEGIVQGERRSQWVYYRLNPDLPSWALSIIRDAARSEEATINRLLKRINENETSASQKCG